MAGCTAATPQENIAKIEKQQTDDVKSGFVFEESEFDFGTIKQSGGLVTHEFKFTYNGEKPINVKSTPSSCMCTEAFIDKQEFRSGDEGTLKVVFNPNLHAEPEGRFFETASIITEPGFEEIPEVSL